MEPQIYEDGELLSYLIDTALANHTFFSSSENLSSSVSLSNSDDFYYLDDSSPTTSFNSEWSLFEDDVDDHDAESSCTSDTFDSADFNHRQRKVNQLEVVHYSILEGTYLTSIELAASRLPLNDSRRELLLGSSENKDLIIQDELLKNVKTPPGTENADLVASRTVSHEDQLDQPYRSQGSLGHTNHSQGDEHRTHVETDVAVAQTSDTTDASAASGTSRDKAERMPFEPSEHEQLDDDRRESQEHPEPESVPTSSLGCVVQVNEFFEIRNTSLGGSGSFSRKNLKRGDVILREHFIIRTNSYTMDAQFESLDLVGRRAHLCLHPHWPQNQENMDVMNAICHTNAFHIGGGTAVFPIAARFNHKCSSMSNIDFDYDPRAGLMVFTVKAEEIVAGEELTLSYGGHPRSLHERYGFFCQCGGCEGWTQEQADELQKLNWGC